MKRKIITIDEAMCNGCGNCISACAEGALQLVNGKARLVKEKFCDGFGDCIGDCPTGALKIVEHDTEAYDPAATRQHVAQVGGSEAVAKFDAAGARHDAGHSHAAPAHPPHGPAGCPGSRMREPSRNAQPATPAASSAGLPAQVLKGDLDQWPVQIHLVQPGAPFFRNRELVVLSTCSPIASADVHWRFIRGRGVVVGCPKLDDTEGYAAKLGAILKDASIPKVIVVRMEVPCCGGLSMIVREAVALSGRTDLRAEEITVGLDGIVLGTRAL